MKNYTRYLLIAVLLFTLSLLVFPNGSASHDEKKLASAGATLALRQSSGFVQGQESSGKSRVYGNIDARVNQPAGISRALASNASAIKTQIQKQGASLQKGLDQLRSASPGAEARLSPLTAGVEIVRNPAGALSGPAQGRNGEEIVRSFIQQNSGLYGLSSGDIADLHFIGESVSQGSGMRMVRVEQVVNGLPVFQSETRFILDRDGRVFRSTGLMVPNASATAQRVDVAGLISAQDALAHAMATVYIAVDAGQATLKDVNPAGTQAKVVANNEHITDVVTSKLVYFPAAPGLLIPAWSQVTFTDGSGDWYTLTDATTGALLWRKNIRASVSAHDARFRVYVQADGMTPADSPAPLSPTNVAVGSGTQGAAISPTIVGMHTVMTAFGNVSQNGWIDDCPGGICTANETQTIGNNVHAYMDRVGGAGAGGANQPDTAASSVLDGEGKPMGNPDSNSRNRDFLGTAPRDFETGYLPPPQGGNPEAGQTATGNGNNGTLPIDQFRRGMVTQLFYVANWYHDRLFQLGFDEAAGNFQQLNFSGQGLGGDRVLAEGQDSSSIDNSNFSTPPDGQSGRAQMFRFIGPTIDRDGALDSEVLIHELTHGLSNRLIGNANGLIWDPGVGMGEGWSDFYALSLLNNTNGDDPDGNYATGAYATYVLSGFPTYTDNYLYGIRRFPYSTNNSVNPLTWADVDDYTNDLAGGITPDPLGANLGGAQEVHNTGEVWCLSLWEVRSRVIAANSNDVPTGNQKMLQLVTDALKLTPVNPSYVDARDALIDADCTTNACANEQSIWDGFADRGLGYGARVSTTYGFAPIASHQSILESFSSPYLDVAGTTVDDSLGNNNGAIDPGETIKLTVTLKNPWRNASKNVASATATLTTSTSGVTVTDGNSTYGAIAAQGSTAGDTFTFTVPANATCGQSLNFTVTPTSPLGTQALPVSFRVGAPNGTGAPITYTRTLGSPLAIQDRRPRGVIDSQTITDDFEIADLNVRIDSLPHTFPGDVTFGFKAPNGYGVDLVSFIGGGVAGGGDGDNITNMVIDDQATGDMLLATNAQAPYTGSWLPIANSPSWPSFGFGPPDPNGELSKMNGASTLGTWRVLVSDQASTDTGTLNSWSLIVTPRAFVCSAVNAPANVTGTKTVSGMGPFSPGGTITYTVILSNSGPGNQGDNAGDEFTDVLPAGVTLSSATATSGTAVATVGTNTVTWNGSIPAGNSVTITINATIDSEATGTISNQGTISYDSDGNSTNDATRTTDDPSVGGASDPTSFTIAFPSDVSGAKSVSGSLTPGSTVTYLISLNNVGLDQSDNPGNEFTDTLPSSLTLVSADASGGTATANTGTNTVTWNGIIPSQDSVTITITATIKAGTEGQMVSNQGTINYDADGNGTNEATRLTDDPAVGGQADPTIFTVCAATHVVTTNADSGAGSLRQAILDACPGTSITFDPSVTSPITLTSGELAVNKDLTITGPTNTSLTISGGNNSRVLSLASGNSLTISNLTITGGNSTDGGGINNQGNLSITNSTLTGNTAVADEGGAIYSSSGTLRIINSTISGNSAGTDGGGLYNTGNSIAFLTNVTVTNNHADADDNASGSGGGINQSSGGNFVLNNTLVAGNFKGTSSPTADDFFVDTFNLSAIDASSSNNLIGVDTGLSTDIANGTNGNQIGTASSPLDPLINPLANNGGPTQTHLPRPGSPLINAGNTSVALNLNNVPLTSDQRRAGFPRVVGSAVDIGAVEANYTVTVAAGAGQSAVINTAFATNLQATVSESGMVQSGVAVTFTAPASGPSGTFPGSVTTVTVNTNGSGVATAPTLTANGLAGSYNVTASVSGGASTALFGLTNLKGTAQVNLSNLTQTYDGSPKAVTVSTVPAGLAVVVTYDGSTTPPINAGTYAVVATVNDANYDGQATGTLTINKADQTITFNPLPNKTFGEADFTVSATASSGLAVFFSVSGQCTISGNTVHLTGPGSCTVLATQAGNNNYNAATPVAQTFNIGQFTLSINNVTLAEGNSGTTSFNFTVTLSGASTLPVSVAYATANGTATAGSDYQAASGTVTFNAGDLTKTISVLVNGDTSNEADETFFVNLTSPQNASISQAQGTGTITNDDAPGIQLSATSYSVNENGVDAVVTVNRTGDTSAAATVDYATSDNAGLTPCSTANSIASQRCDYSISVGTLRFAAGESSKTLFIPIVDDSYTEGAEAFTLTLSNPSGGSLGAQTQATITINDNDAVNGANPISGDAFFIRQHYLDFLARDPDPTGFQGWLGILANCGTTVQQPCDRIEVSSDFFRSDEFQTRGYFIYRFYRAALGRIPFYSEFMPDMARISGFLNTQDLEAAKVSFIADFMNRTEFKTKYDPTLNDPTAYVNLLEQTAGVTLSNKQALITGLQNSTETRATVLRKVIESTEVGTKYFNEAFVVEAYFGYLRRDPDSAYLQWIQIVNQTGGYRTLVNGFINSNEYVQRFGP